MTENKNITRREYIEKGVEFGIDIFHHQSEKWLNIVISPLSIRLALGLTYLAVGPKAKQEMSKTLRLFDDKEMNIDMLARTLCKYSKSDHVHLACKLFVQKSLTIKTGALESFGKLNKSAIHRIDFSKTDKAAKTINSWVEKKTKTKIKDIVKSDDLEDVPLAVISAIYFSVPWKMGFSSTYDGEFWKNESDYVTVPMMHESSMKIRYTELPELKCKSIALPFEDDNHVMIIVLPDSKTGMDALEAEIRKPGFNFLDFRRGSNILLVDVRMPKFQFEYRDNLVEVLVKMGMQSALKTPDFSEFFENPNDDLSISQVIHKTSIQVDENGVEVTAANVAVPPSSEGDLAEFTVSHPFLFAIMSEHNRLLFIGSVRDPSCTTQCRMLTV